MNAKFSTTVGFGSVAFRQLGVLGSTGELWSAPSVTPIASGYLVEQFRPASTESERREVATLVAAVRTLRLTLEARHPNWTASQVALVVVRCLALYNFGGLRDAFRLLARVVEKTGAVLGIEKPGAVLFTEDGRLCMARPVA